MKNVLCAGLLIGVSLSACAGSSDDARAVQGDWTLASGVVAGQAMPAAVAASITMKLADGKYHVLAAGEPDDGTYKLDASSRPPVMMITGTAGPNAGKTFPAIYRLKGDTLLICYDLGGGKAPADFASPAGMQIFLATYVRAKK